MTEVVSIPALRRELRSAMSDRKKLTKLHSIVTESINDSYGEEKEILLKFRQEVKDALNCHLYNPKRSE
ncbi:MAG: hypothetical protein PHD54_15060 [Desulfuromonadaceae bacterium]|nr:hypothetical protein [Desulfuromonadaceae bacterium]